MGRMVVLFGFLAVLSPGAALPVAAQQPAGSTAVRPAEPVPKRPRLQAGADTNDPLAYYHFGTANIDRRPRQAADAFWWAARLAPQAPEPLYGRWAALHLSDPQRLERYLSGEKKIVERPEVQRIDSLQYLALVRNPFLHRTLEKRMLERLVPPAQWVEFHQTLQDMGSRDPGLAAWVAYSEGRLPQALELYARAIKREPDAYGYHNQRAHIFYLMGNYDSAAVQMGMLVNEMRKHEEKQLRYFYDSKALFEYGLGMIYLRQGSLDSARAAFGRALTEDLAFFMAHARLAGVAMATGDTAEALNEIGQAVQLRPDDVALRHQYGEMLLQAGNAGDAATQFQRAIEANPDYAPPYYYLAALWDLQQEPAAALDHYRSFITRAPQREPLLARARERIAALESTSAR